MKILLQPKQIRGRIVKITATKSGIILPGALTQQKKESVLLLIDEVGTEVTNPLCKVGSIVCPLHIGNIVLRGSDFHIIEESAVYVGVGELTSEEIEIEGETPVRLSDTNGPAKDSFSVKS